MYIRCGIINNFKNQGTMHVLTQNSVHDIFLSDKSESEQYVQYVL